MTKAKQTEAFEPYVEEGAAFEALSDRMVPSGGFDVVVIGGGQAGLSVGYHLARQGIRFVILDASERTGDPWRKRWDSLRLFSPAKLNGLDGMRFPAPPNYFPTKDEMADYLEAYAARFRLPIRNGARVESLTREGDRYVVRTARQTFEANQVVIAMSSYQERRIPALAKELDPEIVQVHSFDYKSPSVLRPGAVLVVGAGNSGAEIAKELAARGHSVSLSGRDVGHVPFRIEGFWAKILLIRLVMRVLFHRILTVKTPMGRKARAQFHGKGGPLVRVKPSDLTDAGIARVGRVIGTKDGLPVLEGGGVADVANVIWCTGFHCGHSFVDLPIFDEHGDPMHEGGVVTSEPGLYFVGLHFLYSMSSTMIHGVGRDAERIARIVAERSAERAALPEMSPANQRHLAA